MQIAVLAGGVGAARFLDGLVQVVPPERVTVIVNVGDDFEHLGLRISPDLDTILYMLAGLVHPDQGWGRADETTNALEAVASLGGPEWFLLGDKDIGLHLVRSERLRGGERLSAITADLAHRLDVGVRLLPVTDDPVATSLETSAGTLDFQTYFVKRRHQDTVLAVRYEGAESAAPAPGVLAALEESDVLIVAPSNPYLSIGPILAVEGIARTLARREHPAVAISPIIGGKAVKGPADRMLETFAGEASVVALARHYEGLLTHLLIDDQDAGAVEELEAGGLDVGVTDTLMSDRGARARVAQAAVDLAGVGNDPRPTVDGVSSAGDRDRPRERA